MIKKTQMLNVLELEPHIHGGTFHKELVFCLGIHAFTQYPLSISICMSLSIFRTTDNCDLEISHFHYFP